MTVEIPAHIETRLKDEARRQGVEPSAYAARLIEEALPRAGAPTAAADLATLRLLDEWERETETEDPAELARRQKEFEEFKEAMNRNRLEMEGPDARKIYP